MHVCIMQCVFLYLSNLKINSASFRKQLIYFIFNRINIFRLSGHENPVLIEAVIILIIINLLIKSSSFFFEPLQ